MPTLSIPDDLHRRLAARLLADDVLPRPAAERLLDAEYHAECEADPSPAPTLEEVRAALAKLPGSLAAAVAAGRDER